MAQFFSEKYIARLGGRQALGFMGLCDLVVAVLFCFMATAVFFNQLTPPSYLSPSVYVLGRFVFAVTVPSSIFLGCLGVLRIYTSLSPAAKRQQRRTPTPPLDDRICLRADGLEDCSWNW